MDLFEHTLTERERGLKRLGISHLWRAEPAISLSPQTDPISITPDLDAQETVSISQLPEHIQLLFHGKQPPVRTLWTYEGLDTDITNTEQASRMKMMARIQESARTNLRWSTNDMCIWPLDAELVLFRVGVMHLQPTTILCFGKSDALSQSSTATATGSHPIDECDIVFLPDLGEMDLGNQQLKNIAWKIIQSLTP